MRKLLLGLAVSTAFLAAGAANAQISVSYWVDHGPSTPGNYASNASLANVSVANLGAASGTGTVLALNFDTGAFNSDQLTIDQWLGVATTGAGSHFLDNTVFLFTGSTFLHMGLNHFTVEHDDGLEAAVDGLGIVFSRPGPSSPATHDFDITAPSAGVYNFQLSYGECCGGPAVLQIDTTPGVTQFGSAPEPATWGLMLVGFGGLGAMMRRRRSAALTA